MFKIIEWMSDFIKRVINNIKWKIVFIRMNRNLQKNGYETLAKIDETLSENNICYWLTAGTLLGAYRDKRIINHDLDIDVAIHEKDANIAKDLLISNGFIATHFFYLDNGKLQEISFMYNKTKIDLCVAYSDINHDYVSVFYGEQKVDHKFKVATMILPKVVELKRITLNGHYCNIPKNSEEYLECIYGTDYMIPNKKWNYTRDLNNAIYYSINEKYGWLQSKE